MSPTPPPLTFDPNYRPVRVIILRGGLAGDRGVWTSRDPGTGMAAVTTDDGVNRYFAPEDLRIDHDPPIRPTWADVSLGIVGWMTRAPGRSCHVAMNARSWLVTATSRPGGPTREARFDVPLTAAATASRIDWAFARPFDPGEIDREVS